MAKSFLVVEKENPNHVHANCDTLEGAENWLTDNAPKYVDGGYFDDKTLTAESFTIRKS